jgi:hypothetical protein
MRQKYYSFAFAEDGSSTPAIPDAADPNGFVSYEAGFTFDYQRVLIAGPGNVPPADPLAKSPTWINFNAILKDATVNLQQYQTMGLPEYITPAQNGGSNFTYGRGSMVVYSASGNPDFVPYMALVSTASTPGTDGTWLNLLTLQPPEWTAGNVTAISGASISGTTLVIPTPPLLTSSIGATSGWTKTARNDAVLGPIVEIEQWGTMASGYTTNTFNFPIPFPTLCSNFIITNSDQQGAGNDNAYGYALSNTQFFAGTRGANGNFSHFGVTWRAKGY